MKKTVWMATATCSLLPVVLASTVQAAPAPTTAPDPHMLVAMLQTSQKAVNETLVQPPHRDRSIEKNLRQSRFAPDYRNLDETLKKILEPRRSRLDATGLRFVDTSAEITQRKLTVNKNTATLVFDQHDIYRTAATVAAGTDRDATEERSTRVATFEQHGGRWQLVGTDLLSKAPEDQPLNRPLLQRALDTAQQYLGTWLPFWMSQISAGPKSGVNKIGATAAAPQSVRPTTAVRTARGVDRQKVVQYALDHAFSYNTNYRNMGAPGWGGDCTNFISQAMYAGGWRMSPGAKTDPTKWWYKGGASGTWSHSWSMADQFYTSGLNSKRLKKIAPDDLQVGDLVSADWDPGKKNGLEHTMVVTGRYLGLPGFNGLLFTYHSMDRKNYPSLYLQWNAPGAKFYPLQVQ